MARVETEGWSGGSLENYGVGYGAPFTDIQYPKDEELASNMCFVFSTGRWATGKEYSCTIHSAYALPSGSEATNVMMTQRGTYTRVKDQFDAIPIYRGNMVNIQPMINTVTSAQQEPYGWHIIRGDGILRAGNTFQNSTYNAEWETADSHVYGNTRPITDWNYNNYAVVPYIQGVYAGFPSEDYPNLKRAPFVGGNKISLFDFFHRDFRPASFLSDGSSLLGYTYRYDIYRKGASSPVNSTIGFVQEMSMNMNARAVEYRTEDLSNAYGVVFDSYGFILKNTLLGPLGIKTLSGVSGTGSSTEYAATVWIGPTEIEGIQISKSVSAYIGTYSGLDFYLEMYDVIDPDCMEHFIMTDLVKIAAQLGMPVIASEGALTLYKAGNDISTLGEGEVFFPKKGGNRVNLEELVTGETNIKDLDDYKNGKDGKGAMSTTPEYDRGDTDTNNYTGKVPLNNPPFTVIGVFNRYFALSYTDLIDLADFLYTDDENEIARIVAGLRLNGENPMNFMIGLRMFPFNILSYMTNTETEEISFGNGVHTGVHGEKLNEEDSFTIELGHCKFPKHFKNFLDYEPYTTAKLYIPYCGEVDIPTSVFVGHEINVRLIVDITTGACVGAVSLDRGDNEKYVMFVPGMCSVEIPMTGTNATEYVSRGYDALNKMFSGTGQSLMGMGAIGSSSKAITSSKNYNMLSPGQHSKSMGVTETSRSGTSLPGVVGGLATTLEGGYDFYNMPTPIQTQGSSTPMTSFYKPQQCYFIISRPVLLNVDIGNEMGYACMVKKTISSLADGTMFIAQNPKVQPKNATYQETAELNSLLASGVWK